MFTLRMTCTLTLAVATVACAVSACGNTGGGAGFAGDDASSSSGSSSGETSSSSSGTGSSSGKPGSSGSSSSGRSSSGGSSSGTSGSSSGHDAGADSSSGVSPIEGGVPTNVMYDSNGNPLCGTTGCNLKTNDCCIDTGFLSPKCIANTASACPFTTMARFDCVQQSDCPSGQVCCVTADQTQKTAGSVCEDVSDAGGKCSPPTTTTAGSAQLCQTNAECKTGGQCLWQTCTVTTGGTTSQPIDLTMCGLQNSSVFTCTAH